MDFLIRSYSTLRIYFWCVVLVAHWINEYSWMCRKPICIIVISTRVIKLCKLHPHISIRPHGPLSLLMMLGKYFFSVSPSTHNLCRYWWKVIRWSHFLTWPCLFEKASLLPLLLQRGCKGEIWAFLVFPCFSVSVVVQMLDGNHPALVWIQHHFLSL